MSYSPIAFIAPQYEQLNYWLKGYEQGTTTDLSMATDATGGTLLARAEVGNDGYIKTVGGAKFIPHFNADYDLYLFPTAAEADADDTTNAIQVADNISPSVDTASMSTVARRFPTLATAKANTGNLLTGALGEFAYIEGRPEVYKTVSAATGTADDGSYIDMSAFTLQLEAQWSQPGRYPIAQWGALFDATSNADIAATAQTYIVANGGGELLFDNGRFTSNPFVKKAGVTLVGTGMVHRAFYVSDPAAVLGTVILIDGAIGGDCVAFEDTAHGKTGIRNLSIFDTGTNAIQSAISINGALHWYLMNVETGPVTTRNRGAGLLVNRGTAGGAIYGAVFNFVTTKLATGLILEDDANAIHFAGGSIQGDTLTLDAADNVLTSGPQAVSFAGTAFEMSYDAAKNEHIFVPAADNIHGFSNTDNCYVTPGIKLRTGRGYDFSGCYFEIGGVPGTYDDGSNGSWPLAPVIEIQDGVQDIDYTGRLNGYIWDKGTNIEVQKLPSGTNYNTKKPIKFLRRNTTATVVPHNTLTALTYVNTPAWQTNLATEFEYNNTTGELRFRQPGCYKIYAQIFFPSITNNFSYLRSSFNPNYTGTHDGAGNAAALTDSTATFGVNNLVGYTITNTTDGSSGTITANTATVVTATLTGGTDNDWDASDAYTITHPSTAVEYYGPNGAAAGLRSLSIDVVYDAAAGDTCFIEMLQTTGGNVTVDTTANHSQISCVKIGT